MTRSRQNAVRNLLWEGEFYCANAECFGVVRRKSRESRQKSRIPQKLKASFLWWLTNEVVSSSEVFWQASDRLSNCFFLFLFFRRTENQSLSAPQSSSGKGFTLSLAACSMFGVLHQLHGWRCWHLNMSESRWCSWLSTLFLAAWSHGRINMYTVKTLVLNLTLLNLPGIELPHWSF